MIDYTMYHNSSLHLQNSKFLTIPKDKREKGNGGLEVWNV